MSQLSREPPVSGILLEISLIVRVWSETHRSSREQRHSLALGHTVKFGRLLPLTVTALNDRFYARWSFNYSYEALAFSRHMRGEKQAVVVDSLHPRSGQKRRGTCVEIQWFQHHMRGATWIRGLDAVTCGQRQPFYTCGR